jgi:hypothetical protein
VLSSKPPAAATPTKRAEDQPDPDRQLASDDHLREPASAGAAFARAPGGLLLKRLCFAVCVGLTSTFLGFAVAMAAPAAQSNICPVAVDPETELSS